MDWIVETLRRVRALRDWRMSRRRRKRGEVGARAQAPSGAPPVLPAGPESGVNGGSRGGRSEDRLLPRIGPVERPRPAPSRESEGRRGGDSSRRDQRRGRDQGRGRDRGRDGRPLGPPPKLPVDPEIPLHLIDRDALDVVRRLRRAGFRAYLVGGCVRDLRLGMTPKDFDVATDARPEEIRSVFRNSRIIGRRFRLAHVYFRGGKIIETSTFRANLPNEPDSDLLIRQDNVFGTEEEDALRRDFTVNALFYDVETGRIIDHVGGRADLESRTLRMIGDPEIRLREDPVRIIRAVRLAAKGGLAIEPVLLESMQRHRQEIFRCSKPRLLEETFKLLRGGQAERSIRLGHECGVLDVIFPELLEHLTPSEPGAPEIDVFSYLSALDRLVRRQGVSDTVMLASLLSLPVRGIQAESEPSQHLRLTTDYLAEVCTKLGVTRKMSERLRQIFLVQRSLPRSSGKRGRRRVAPAVMARRSYFEDAIDLFEIETLAENGDLEDVRFWRERAYGSDEVGDEEPLPDEESGEESESSEGERPRRRRRRRRAGPRSGAKPA